MGVASNRQEEAIASSWILQKNEEKFVSSEIKSPDCMADDIASRGKNFATSR